MNKDGCYTSVHMHHPRMVELFEDICKDRLPSDDVFVPPQHQPINPEDEDDVVPDQHAAFGIQKATQAVREPAWKDLGLYSLMHRGPSNSGGVGHAENNYAYYGYLYGYNGSGLNTAGTGDHTAVSGSGNPDAVTGAVFGAGFRADSGPAPSFGPDASLGRGLGSGSGISSSGVSTAPIGSFQRGQSGHGRVFSGMPR